MDMTDKRKMSRDEKDRLKLILFLPILIPGLIILGIVGLIGVTIRGSIIRALYDEVEGK